MSHKPFVLQKPGYRVERMSQRIKEELSLLVPELEDPRLDDVGLITITNVTAAKDLRNAVVMFSVLDKDAKTKEIEAALNEASGYLRRQLRLSFSTKVTPQLLFKFDKGLVGSMHMDAVFKQVEDERKARAAETADSQATTADTTQDETDETKPKRS